MDWQHDVRKPPGQWIQRLHVPCDHAEWDNEQGWPLADGHRVVRSLEGLERAEARAIERGAVVGQQPARPAGRSRGARGRPAAAFGVAVDSRGR